MYIYGRNIEAEIEKAKQLPLLGADRLAEMLRARALAMTRTPRAER
jgi:hypothetical protein